MIGRTLFFYIAWRFVKSLLAMMALLFFLIVTIDFIEGLRRVKEGMNVSTGQVYLISLYTAPWFIDKAFPFACLFASMTTLSQLNQKLELVVARAAGISAWQFLLPITGAAMVVGIAVSTLYNPLAIDLYEKSIDMKAQLLGVRSPTNAKSRDGFWLRQDDKNGSSVINATLARRGGTLLDGVRIIQIGDDDKVASLIEADKAIHRGDRWTLINVKITDKSQKVKNLQTYDLPTNISSEYLFGASGAPDTLNIWQLVQAAKKVAASGLNHLPYLVQFQSLLALPLLLVAMVIIAATVSLKFVRFGQSGNMILVGIFSGFMLYAISRLVTSLGNNGIVPPTIAAWSPPIIAILFGMSMLLHQEDG